METRHLRCVTDGNEEGTPSWARRPAHPFGARPAPPPERAAERAWRPLPAE